MTRVSSGKHLVLHDDVQSSVGWFACTTSYLSYLSTAPVLPPQELNLALQECLLQKLLCPWTLAAFQVWKESHGFGFYVALVKSCLTLFCVLLCKGLSQRNDLYSEVGVVGQRVTYSNGTIKAEEEATGPSPPLVKPALSESFRALKPLKGQPAGI